jgi:hypothetical protein
MAVLHRVEVDVVEVPLEVVFVLDRVLPELRLPDAAPPVCLSPVADRDFSPTCLKPALSELRLDPLPAS